MQKDLITPNQSGLNVRASCINEYKSFIKYANHTKIAAN